MEARRLREDFFQKVQDATLSERLFSALPDVVFCLKDLDRIYVSANEAFAERVGLGSRWEVVGQQAEDLFPAALADHYRAQDEEVLKSKEGFWDRLELLPLRDGNLGWFLASKIPVKGRGGKVVGLASISRDLRLPSGSEMGYAKLARVVEEVEAGFADELDRAKLAEKAGLSERQLERRLKRVFGLSLKAFVRKLRVEHGARLLVESDASLSEVALACGYSDQSAFTRQFKATVGIPPGRYRLEYHGWW